MHRLIFASLLTVGCGIDSPYCAEDVSVLSSLDDVSPLGWRGRDVLEPAVGRHESRLAYGDLPGDGVAVQVSAPEPTTDVEIEVSAQQPEVRFVDGRVEGQDSRSDVEVYCPARLEVDARIEVRTADGLLDETFDAALVMVEPPQDGADEADAVPFAIVELDLDALAGSLAITSIDPADPTSLHTELFVAFPPEGMWGRIEGSATYDQGDANAAGIYTLARWPEFAGDAAEADPVDVHGLRPWVSR